MKLIAIVFCLFLILGCKNQACNEEPHRLQCGIGILPQPTLLRQGYGRVLLAFATLRSSFATKHEHPRGSLLRRSSHFGCEGWKPRGILAKENKKFPETKTDSSRIGRELIIRYRQALTENQKNIWQYLAAFGALQKILDTLKITERPDGSLKLYLNNIKYLANQEQLVPLTERTTDTIEYTDENDLVTIKIINRLTRNDLAHFIVPLDNIINLTLEAELTIKSNEGSLTMPFELVVLTEEVFINIRIEESFQQMLLLNNSNEWELLDNLLLGLKIFLKMNTFETAPPNKTLKEL